MVCRLNERDHGESPEGEWRRSTKSAYPPSGRTAKPLSCPRCGTADKSVHHRTRLDWRHFACFRFEARLHSEVPHVDCTACGQTTQPPAPWAHEGGGYRPSHALLAG